MRDSISKLRIADACEPPWIGVLDAGTLRIPNCEREIIKNHSPHLNQLSNSSVTEKTPQCKYSL